MKDSHTKNFICEDILINILARLPAKSLVRFMCVCKSWSNLIGSSSFITTHLNRNIKNHDHLYLISHHYYRGGRRSLISLFSNETFEQCLELQHPSWTKERFRVYGSSNGLVCISDKRLSSTSSICIWNPSIRKSLSLPKTYIPDHSNLDSEISLSFCFHPNHNDYKVVKMLHEWNKVSMEVEVYSLSNNSWKVIEITPWLNSGWWYLTGYEVCNGIVYWLISGGHYRIVSFDTGREKFGELVVPEPILPVKGAVKIEVYKETICLLQGETDVDLWVLQEGSFQRLRTILLPRANIFILIGLFTDNGLLVQEQSRFTELDLFDLESNQLKSTGILMCQRKLHTYIESLVLLDH
ncbi:putative F-box domain, galactose oxidase/kelch, beta-propeller, F-box associated interaction [Rosa chinensis]|uniref:Putative F-box domain, galactose oxidase/kelch, beta-propeller, F-box associated interaction n=1 Tax=Rosa chinensis TaxID=74649 RepID=A0A2P6S911_ROSCH|nr:F-box protein CPR1 [Rosa chinensis]PRQ55178.1 putative F-box domain, galactose oxidase/kelch, beta-propeller, F-box associated interaction [Rosa chinensis]